MNIATLISAKELATLLQEKNDSAQRIVVLDCRFDLADPSAGARLFAQAHIPSAQHVDLEKDLSSVKDFSSAQNKHGGRHPLPSDEAAQTLFRRLGISNDTTVVVYDERHAFASRCWWLLRYLGHDRVRVLNGGFTAWLREKLPTSTTAVTQVKATPTPGNFTAKPRPQMLCSYAQVAALVDDEDATFTLIDSREADRFRGEREPIDPVAGHIPGAVNVPWMDINDEQTQLKPPSSQRARWQTLADSHPPSTQQWIVYCGSGVTGAANVLSLHLAGYGDVPLYAGSWSDWISYEDSPIAVGNE